MIEQETITTEEVKDWCGLAMSETREERAIRHLKEILSGEYSLEEARQDILSFRQFERGSNEST